MIIYRVTLNRETEDEIKYGYFRIDGDVQEMEHKAPYFEHFLSGLLKAVFSEDDFVSIRNGLTEGETGLGKKQFNLLKALQKEHNDAVRERRRADSARRARQERTRKVGKDKSDTLFSRIKAWKGQGDVFSGDIRGGE